MVEAAENASHAATMAAEAIKQMQASAGSATDEKAWYRIFPKPAVFDCKDRETEIATWRDWAWTFEQYLGSLDANFVDDIKTLRANPSTEVDMSVQTDVRRGEGSFFTGFWLRCGHRDPFGFEASRRLQWF